MMRATVIAAIALLPMILVACATTGDAIDDSRLGMLASELGITSEQAQAAAGSMLELAEFRLDQADYQRIAKYVPRAEEYKALAERLGAFQRTIGSRDDLDRAFTKLGLSADQSEGLVAAVTDYLDRAGGHGVSQLLRGALR